MDATVFTYPVLQSVGRWILLLGLDGRFGETTGSNLISRVAAQKLG